VTPVYGTEEDVVADEFVFGAVVKGAISASGL
jgi:hypothetical protein